MLQLWRQAKKQRDAKKEAAAMIALIGFGVVPVPGGLAVPKSLWWLVLAGPELFQHQPMLDTPRQELFVDVSGGRV
jgi:hypothetical protein